MDIITFSEELQNRMKAQISAADNTESTELAITAQRIAIIRGMIYELEQALYSYTFKDQQEEIRFFKEIKPLFVSQYFYHSKIFSIKLFASFNDPTSCKIFYEGILKQLEYFASRNKDFYIYILSNATHFDNQYFTVRNKFLLRGNPFAAPMDEKLARVLANELLKEYLSRMTGQQIKTQEVNLKWTASKTSLVELGVALQSVGAFNNSDTQIKTIFSAFEKIFHVDLKDHYRIFLQIKDRKKGQTAFLDQLKERFVQKINDEDKYNTN